MSDHDAELRRYAALSDRLALGEKLAPDEHAFLERMEQRDEACRLEAELFASLGELDAPPSEQTRALVDAALAQVARDGRRGESLTRPSQRTSQQRHTRLWIAGAGALLAAAAALLVVLARGGDGKHAGEVEDRIELVYVSGEVRVGDKPAASSSRLLHEGDVLAIGSGGACIAMDPQIDVCATAGSRLRLTQAGAPLRRLDLLEGKVAVQLAPQPEGYKLSIVSDGIWSTAVGTAFTVERDETQGVKTTVLHGKVRVGANDARAKLVSAHQRARVRSGSLEAEVHATSRSDESPGWALLGPTKLWNAVVSATLEVDGAPEGAQVLLDGQAIGVAPISTLVPAGVRMIDVRVDGTSLWSHQVTFTAGSRERFSLEGVEPAPPVALPAAPASEPTATATTPQHRLPATKPRAGTSSAELLREARGLLRAGELNAAAGKYAELVRAHPSSPEARSSLLSLAELELEHLGNAAAALEYADKYLASGGGPLAPEARETRVRALRSLGRRADERAAIAEYLQAYPDSLRAPALGKRLSELGGTP